MTMHPIDAYARDSQSKIATSTAPTDERRVCRDKHGSPDVSDFEYLFVREALNRVGLLLFPTQWTGKEYRDHWRLGLSPWPATKLRGVVAERELLRLVAEGQVIVEREAGGDEFVPLAPVDVRHFHGSQSLVAGEDGPYEPCRLRFPLVTSKPITSGAGRKPFDYPGFVVRVCRHLDGCGSDESTDRITHTIRAHIEREGGEPPHYSKLQPYVSAMLAYRRGQQFPESISGRDDCDGKHSAG